MTHLEQQYHDLKNAAIILYRSTEILKHRGYLTTDEKELLKTAKKYLKGVSESQPKIKQVQLYNG